MKKFVLSGLFIVLWALICTKPAYPQNGTIPFFLLKTNEISLEHPAQPGNPFNKAGRKFVILADESGSFEAWAYPLKLFRNFQVSFLTGDSTRLISGKDTVRSISVTPEAVTIRYTYQSFTVEASYITPIDEPGALLLFHVDSTQPLTIVCSFIPVLQPMWPAGIGGQYAYWNNELKAYVISEPTGKNHGIVGSPAASGISYTPAHMLSDNPNEFKIEISDPDKVRDKYIPLCIAGGMGSRAEVISVYNRLLEDPKSQYLKNFEHYQKLRKNTLQVKTPNQALDVAFEWAKVTFDNLLVNNPNLGTGMVAGLGASGTSGRPGFGWFFGGDAYINSLSILSYGDYPTCRTALAFTQKWQRDDGKMSHELSQAEGYIDWWNDYHYGYIHGDTTPYYIAAMHDYMRYTGDVEFIRTSWESLTRAFNWCLQTDANQDGLMDNKKAGLGALEYGALTGIETDIYLAAVWVKACESMAKMSQAVKDSKFAELAGETFIEAQKAFKEKFWDAEKRFYSYAFNSNGEHVKEISPWNAVGLMWKLGTEENSRLSLEKLCSGEIMTDWGIRSISNKSSFFQPLNYNYGAVWPFLSSWVNTALFKHHMPQQGYTLLCSTAAHTYTHNLGCLTEVFSGTHNVWPQEAVSQQGFSSAGIILPFIRGLLGLEGDAHNKTIVFSPHFPADWDHVEISNLKIGTGIFLLSYKRENNRITVDILSQNSKGFKLHFVPALGLGSKIHSLKIDGSPVDFTVEGKNQAVLLEAEIDLSREHTVIEIEFTPSLEILPVYPVSKVGDRNHGLKLIHLSKQSNELIIRVEGLSEQYYTLSLLNSEKILSAEGAELKNGLLFFTIPEKNSGDFSPHTIRLFIR
jgi:glycogen debranching enzyme